MTRTTLKALWFGGGGILATWLAVTPNVGVPGTSPAAAVQRSASANQSTAEELNAQAVRLRERTAAVTLRPSTRNPFIFSAPKPAPRSNAPRVAEEAAAEPIASFAPVGAGLRLSGVAQDRGKRTAIISGDGGQVYVAAVGDLVAGRFTVVAVDPEAVLLRDSSGVEERLVLPQ